MIRLISVVLVLATASAAHAYPCAMRDTPLSRDLIPTQTRQISMSIAINNVFARNTWIRTGGGRDCPGSKVFIDFAKSMVKPRSPQQFADWEDSCLATSSVGTLINIVYALAWAGPKDRQNVSASEITGDLLKDGLSRFYQDVWSTTVHCENSDSLASMQGHRLNLWPAFLIEMTVVEQLYAIVHESVHGREDAPGHNNNNCDLTGSDDAMDRIADGAKVCDDYWHFETDIKPAYQVQTEYIAEWLVANQKGSGGYMKPLWDLSEDVAERQWTSLLRTAGRYLDAAFETPACVAFNEDGSLNYSDCEDEIAAAKLQKALAEAEDPDIDIGDIGMEPCDLIPCPIEEPTSRQEPVVVDPDPEREECYSDWRYDEDREEVCYYDVCPEEDEPWQLQYCVDASEPDEDDVADEEPRGTVRQFCIIQGCNVEYESDECPLGCFKAEGCQDWEPDPCVCLARCNRIDRSRWEDQCWELERKADGCD